ncbi:MAG: helix-turn-helix domain-containing protein [Shinella sp.]|nr:helix-turn-helix domain-containing protein [Shinella sp.]
MLKVTGFSTESLPEDQRVGAWSSHMAALNCKVVADADGGNFVARLGAAVTAWGFAIARLEMSAQRLLFDTRTLANGLWLMQVAEGRGTLKTERGSQAFEKGDILYGKAAREMSVNAPARVRINCAYFPRSGAGARLASIPIALVASRLLAGHGSTEFLSGLLNGAADKLPRITGDEIRPLETAITEFLFAAVMTASAANNLIDGSRTRNALVLRATQLLEAQLCDPDLSPADAARHLGISVRYLQKLFEEVGENVNQYIRRRRLERSYQELMDPLYHQQSISEISFRWGFNDSAYFSRSFKDLFGLSPSQHRERWRWRDAGRMTAGSVKPLRGLAERTNRSA